MKVWRHDIASSLLWPVRPEGFRKCDDHFRQILPASRSTQLNWEILVPVPDDVFTIIGISLIGFANTILRSWNRVTVENVF